MPADTPLAKKPGTLILLVDFTMTATPLQVLSTATFFVFFTAAARTGIIPADLLTLTLDGLVRRRVFTAA
jgi:hypothetical protein